MRDVLEFIVWDIFDRARAGLRSWRPTHGILTAQLAVAALAVVVQIGLPQGHAAMARPARHLVAAKSHPPLILIATHAPPPPARPGPRALQERLDQIAAAYHENVGIAVSRVDRGWVAAVDGDALFPQQSVSKTWVALSVLEAVDRGRLRLDQPVAMRLEDRSVFFQPLGEKIGRTGGYVTTVGELLRHALINSDNAANDRLMGLAGGVEGVRQVLQAKGLASGIRLGADERHLQAGIAGMTWRPEYGISSGFKDARARWPQEIRDSATERYISDPMDGASPVAIAQALAALRRGELLSPSSSALMLGIMAQARTGPRRLRGGLPAGWTIAHKTGTGQNWRGGAIGINDVALLTAPDGQTYAVAVMIRNTRKGTPARLAMMQEVSKAVVADWQAEHDHPTPPPPAPDNFPRPALAP